MKKNKFLFSVVIIILYLVGIIIGMSGVTSVNLMWNIISAIFFLFYVKSVTESYSNLIFLFCAFHVLYGLSGPIAVYYFGGLSSLFGSIFNINIFLIAYDLASMALIIGILVYLRRNKVKKNIIKLNEKLLKNKNLYLYFSIFIIFIASLCEIINFIRAGGINTLFQGKAVYQANVSELLFTLPTDMFISIAFVLVMLYVTVCIKYNIKKNWFMLSLFAFLSLPCMAIYLFLGRRGTLLSMALIAFLVITHFNPLTKMRKRIVFYGVVLYFCMTFLVVNRAIMPLIFTDIDLFMEKVSNNDRFISALNPATAEFGSTFGNFNMLYTSNDYSFKYGKSYIEGLAIAIPQFLYLGEKPLQITYEFRDRYFFSESLRSSIAGTGFSSILEAYWNFGYLGIVLIYFIIGYFLSKLEIYYKEKSENFFIIYFTISPFIISFHRYAMGDIIASILHKVLLVLICVYIPMEMLKKK